MRIMIKLSNRVSCQVIMPRLPNMFIRIRSPASLEDDICSLVGRRSAHAMEVLALKCEGNHALGNNISI
jgi:hypothetical protein